MTSLCEKKLYRIKKGEGFNVEQNVDASKGKNLRVIAVAATSLNQLKTKAAEFFALDVHLVDIMAPCGSYIADDDTLDFLYTKDSVFVVEAKLAEGSESSQMATEHVERTPSMETDAIDPLLCAASTDSMEVDELASAGPSGETSQMIPRAHTAGSNDYYDIPAILKQFRAGVKGDSAKDIINRLSSCEKGSEHDERLLRKATGTWLITNCSKHSEGAPPTDDELTKMAKSIIHRFPCMANKASERPWDTFYDDKTKTGPLAQFCRNKRSRINSADKSDGDHSRNKGSPAYTLEEVSEAELYMRENVNNAASKLELMNCLEITRTARRKFVRNKTYSATQILNRYPVFKHLEEAVHDEFLFITTGKMDTFVKNWKSVERNLYDVATKEDDREAVKTILREADTATQMFDCGLFTEKMFELLPFLLPYESPRHKAKGKNTEPASFGLIYRNIQELVTPQGAVEKATEMKQPGIFKLADTFFLKVEDLAVKLPDSAQRLPEAFGYLVMYYYILDTKYENVIGPVFVFFELLFNIKPSRESKRARQLFSSVFKRQ